MSNNEMLLVIKDMFEKSVSDIRKEFKSQISDVKNHMGVLVEKLEGDIKLLAEGYGVLNDKFDTLNNKVDTMENKVDRMQLKVDHMQLKVDCMQLKVDSMDKRLGAVEVQVKGLRNDMTVVKDFVIGVDAKLNEHEVIIKRVK